MTDFVPVLIAATIAMLALFLIFGGIFISVSDADQQPTSITGTYYDRIGLGSNFTVSDFQESYKLMNLTGNVSAGLISGVDHEILFSASNRLDEFDYGKIKLDVKETNIYGAIIISINDNMVFSNGTLAGVHEIKFNKNILNETGNILEVKAEGSGWRLWAPTVYIFDLTVYGEIDEQSVKTTEFNLSYVPSYARLRVYVSDKEGTGYLRVNINDYKVYRGRSNGFKSFDPDILKEGTNTAEIIAESGSRFDVESVYITFE